MSGDWIKPSNRLQDNGWNRNAEIAVLDSRWIDTNTSNTSSSRLLSAEKTKKKVRETARTIIDTSNEFEPFELLRVVLVPLDAITVIENEFQNRETAFSEESVLRIIHDIRNGEFAWEIFDPIRLHEENGELFLLSGHSRLEAFRRIIKEFWEEFLASQYKHSFTKIPAIVIRGKTREEARTIALRSNTLATPETPIERANHYRRLREGGAQKHLIEEEAHRQEGRDAAYILSLSYLDSKGKTLSYLRASRGHEDFRKFQQRAEWIGKLREQFWEIGNIHEEEIFLFTLAQQDSIKSYESLFARVDLLLTNIREKKWFISQNELLGIERVQSTVSEDEVRTSMKRLQNELRKKRADHSKVLTKIAEYATMDEETLKYRPSFQDIHENPELYREKNLRPLEAEIFSIQCQIEEYKKILGFYTATSLDQGSLF